MASTFDYQRYEQAIKLAQSEGNTAAVNELSAIYTEAKAKERSGFVEHTPTQMTDVLPAIGEGLEGAVTTATQGIAEVGSLLDAKKIHTPEAVPLGLVKAALPAAGDVVLTGLAALGDVVSLATPDSLEKEVVEAVKGAVFDIADNPVFQEGLELAKQGMAPFIEWGKEHPDAALRLGASFELGLMALPATKVPPVSAALDNVAGSLLRAGNVQGITKRHDGIQRLLEPLKLNRSDIRRTETRGVTREHIVGPDARGEEVIKVLALIPEVKVGRTYVKNANAVYDEIEATSERLTKRLQRAGNPEVDTTKLTDNMDAALESYFKSDDPIIAGLPKPRIEAIVNKAKSLVAESDGTVVGVLEARKKLDSYLNNLDVNLDGEFVASKGKALKIIRDTLNNAVNDTVSDVDVLGLLRKQHLMYTAWDTLADKAIHEARTGLSRAYINAQRATGMSIPTTPLALAATAGGAATLATTGLAAWGIGAASTVAAGVLVQRMLTSPSAKKGLGVLLGAVSKGIKMSKNKEMIEQLKADRLIIISLLEQKEDTNQRVPMKGAVNGR